MKNLIRIFLILTIIGGAVSLHSACSDENDCSLAGRPMSTAQYIPLIRITLLLH